MTETTIMSILFVGVTILFMIWLGLRAETRKARGTLETREERMLREMSILESTVKTLLIKLNESQNEIEKIKNKSRQEIAELRQQLEAALKRISELEIMYEIAPGQPLTRITPKRKLLKPLLVVCGTDERIFGADLAVLNDIGIRYTRLLKATQSDVSSTIATAIEDDRPYRWLLISADAGPNGVELEDGPALADFWMRVCNGFEVVGLAVCKSTAIAEHLKYRVGFIWFFREDVPTDPANRFVKKFFQRLSSGEDAESAFCACLDAVPEVAAFADYRNR